MSIKDRITKSVKRADQAVQATARFTGPISRFLRFIVIFIVLLILAIFTPIAAGLGLAGSLFHAQGYIYGALVACGVMGVLLVLIVNFKVKATKILMNIKDLAGLTDYLLDELFETLREGIIAVGVIMLVIGGGFGAGAYLLEKGWMWPLALSLLVAGVFELLIGMLVYVVLVRALERRIKEKAKEVLDWAQIENASDGSGADEKPV